MPLLWATGVFRGTQNMDGAGFRAAADEHRVGLAYTHELRAVR